MPTDKLDGEAERRFIATLGAALAEYDVARARKGIDPSEPPTGHEHACECALCAFVRTTRECVLTYRSEVPGAKV